MKQQKVYIYDDLFVGVSNCDNEKEAREVIEKRSSALLDKISKPLGIRYIRFGWFTEYDHDGDEIKYCIFHKTKKLGRGAIKVFAFGCDICMSFRGIEL